MKKSPSVTNFPSMATFYRKGEKDTRGAGFFHLFY